MPKKKYSKETLRKKLYPVFRNSGIKLAYLFGSQAKGKTGPLSDVDIALLWPHAKDSVMLSSIELQAKIRLLLKDENIELGALNNQAISFCYQVIKDGYCIFGREKDRAAYETRAVSEYLDFLYFANQYDRIFDSRHKHS